MFFNLRKFKGTFKGIIGECMFKLTDKKVILTRFMNKRKFFEIYKNYIDRPKMLFLMRNWYSIDAVKYDNGQLTIYEIKTRNAYKNKVPYRTKITRATVVIYNKAKSLGFDVKLVVVWLYKNWNFRVTVKDFNITDFCVDKPKKYDSRKLFRF